MNAIFGRTIGNCSPFRQRILWGAVVALMVGSPTALAADDNDAPQPVAVLSAEPTSDELRALLSQVDNSGRGDTSHSMVEMQVKTKRYQRNMKMEAWSKGAERSLIRFQYCHARGRAWMWRRANLHHQHRARSAIDRTSATVNESSSPNEKSGGIPRDTYDELSAPPPSSGIER